MWKAFVAASNNGDIEPPALSQHAGDSALTTLNKGLALNQSRGLHSKGNPILAPEVTAIRPVTAPTSISISDCVDDSRWLLYRPDGRLADDEPGGRRRAIARVEKTSGVWKVTMFALHGTGTC